MFTPGPSMKVDSAGARVLADDGSHSLRQFGVPGRRQPTPPKAVGPIVANADRAIRHLQSRQMNVVDFANVEIVDATDQVDFFFQRKLLEQRVDAGIDVGREGCGAWHSAGRTKSRRTAAILEAVESFAILRICGALRFIRALIAALFPSRRL